MNRKKFLKTTLITSGIVLTASAGGIYGFHSHFSSRNGAKRILNFSNLEQAVVEIGQIRKAGSNISLAGEWSLYQNLIHCSQSIEFSISGFPENKAQIFQNTIGALVFDKFERQGYMRHNRNEVIPKAPEIPTTGSEQQAFERLIKAIHDFDTYQGVLKPHFAYGKLSKKAYEKAHAMHLADHFAAMTYTRT